MLNLPPRPTSYIASVLKVVLILQLASWANALINFYLKRYREDHLQKNAASVTTFSFLSFLAKLTLFSFLLLFLLNNLGINITTVLTGLGIGGIAIALAAQNVLGDLFASLAIVLDRPFVLQDYIVVGNLEGTVENIGA